MSPRTTSSTASARATTRPNPSPRWASTARPRQPATPSSAWFPATTSCGPAGSSAKATTSSAPWRPSPAAASNRPWSTTRSAGSASPRTSPPASGTCSRSGAAYGTYNLSNDGEPQSWADIAADVYELSGQPRDRRHRRQHRGILQGQGRRAPAAEQRAGPEQDQGHRVPGSQCRRAAERVPRLLNRCPQQSRKVRPTACGGPDFSVGPDFLLSQATGGSAPERPGPGRRSGRGRGSRRAWRRQESSRRCRPGSGPPR